jgi:hypothetical protein
MITKTKAMLSAFVTVLAIVAGSISSQAQTTEEHHKTITTHHSSAADHAKKIHTGESKTVTEHKTHATEAGKSIGEAKNTHQKLKSSLTPEQQKATAANHTAIEKHHADATAHHKALTDELAKPTPDEAKAKEHAKNMHNSVQNAEKENQTLKTKTTKK